MPGLGRHQREDAALPVSCRVRHVDRWGREHVCLRPVEHVLVSLVDPSDEDGHACGCLYRWGTPVGEYQETV
jgi:hypothetical protein